MKILVIRYRFIGDTVLTIPFLRNLRKAYPDAQIDMLVGPVSGDVLQNCPYIDNLIVFDTTKKHRYENTSEAKKSFLSYVWLLRKNKYDKAYVLKRSLSSTLLAFLAGIKERIGFDTEKRGFLLTKKVPYIKDRHEVECFLDVLRANNIPVLDNYLENWLSEKSVNRISEIFKYFDVIDRPKVLLHATSGNKRKEWMPEYFAEIIKYLSNQKGVQIFYTGTKEDSEVYKEIHNLISQDLVIKPVNLCGELSIQDSMALINKMGLVIGVDSGTLHIAASLNVPVIGIYGPMDPVKWHAWGNIHKIMFYNNIPCSPCELSEECFRDRACLRNITPDMIIRECDKILFKN